MKSELKYIRSQIRFWQNVKDESDDDDPNSGLAVRQIERLNNTLAKRLKAKVQESE